jgi:hypothetical protein
MSVYCSICDFVGYLKNDILERTVCWHQIFLKLGEHVKETFKTLKSFGEQARGMVNFLAVFEVQKWYDSC